MVKAKKTFDMGTLTFIAAIILSAIFAYIQLDNIGYMILALLGALIAIQNIVAIERKDFILATAALTVFIIGLFAVIQFPLQLRYFLENLLIVFDIAGFIVVLGQIVKIGSTR